MACEGSLAVRLQIPAVSRSYSWKLCSVTDTITCKPVLETMFWVLRAWIQRKNAETCTERNAYSSLVLTLNPDHTLKFNYWSMDNVRPKPSVRQTPNVSADDVCCAAPMTEELSCYVAPVIISAIWCLNNESSCQSSCSHYLPKSHD